MTSLPPSDCPASSQLLRGSSSTLGSTHTAACSTHHALLESGPPHHHYHLFDIDRSLDRKFATCSNRSYTDYQAMIAVEDIWCGSGGGAGEVVKISSGSGQLPLQTAVVGKENNNVQVNAGLWPPPLLSDGGGYGVIHSPHECCSNDDVTAAADLMFWGSHHSAVSLYRNDDFDDSAGDLIDAIFMAAAAASSSLSPSSQLQQLDGVFSGADSARGSCSPPSSSVQHVTSSHPTDHEFSSPISDPSSCIAMFQQQQGSPYPAQPQQVSPYPAHQPVFPSLMQQQDSPYAAQQQVSSSPAQHQLPIHHFGFSIGLAMTSTTSSPPESSHTSSLAPQFCTEKLLPQPIGIVSHVNEGGNNTTRFSPLIKPSSALAQMHGSRGFSPPVQVEMKQQQKQSGRGKEREIEEGVDIINLLAACVEAISAGNITTVNHLLARLGRQASPTGSSSVHRMAAYFTEGLACRVSKLWPQLYHPLSVAQITQASTETTQTEAFSDMDPSTSAWQVLNRATPLVKFSQYTANEMILQAFEGEEKVHVIDLDIREGLQWPALFHSLASRHGGPPKHIRLTGIGECKEDVQDAGDRLAEFAEEMGLNFEFHGVVDKLEDVRLWMLHVKQEAKREAVAVNCVLQLHRSLRDETGDEATKLLSLIRSTRPKVVAVIEQEAGCEGGKTMEARCAAAMRYFAALFDAIEAGSEQGGGEMAEAYLGEQIRNIVACDGEERVERYQEVKQWRELLSRLGFQSVGVSDRARLQAQMLLRMFSSAGTRYCLHPPWPSAGAAEATTSPLEPGDDHLTLLWGNQPLLTASAWAPLPP